MALDRAVLSILLLVSAGPLGAQATGRTRAGTGKVDPTNIQLSATMDSVPAIGVPNVVKLGSVFTLSCKWDVKFVKPTSLHDPIPMDVRITDTFNGITVLKSATASVKAGAYPNPGMQVVGGIVVPWKPNGLGNHELTCQAGITAQEWWGPATIPIAQKKWTILVDPEKFTQCLPLYAVTVTKDPKMGTNDHATPAAMLLGFDHAQGIGNEIVCHYHSANKDLPDFAVSLPCPGVTLLAPIPGQITLTPRFFCKN